MTEPNKDRTPRRLAVMVVLLGLAVGAALMVQAQPERPGPGAPPDSNAQPAPAQPGTSAPQPQPGATANTPAQNPPAEPDGPIKLSDQPVYKLGQLFMFSPIINGIIAGLSALGLMFFLYFMLTINRRTFAPPRFVDEVVKLVIRGDYERAGDVCRRSRGVFAAGIVQRCVENHNQAHSVMLGMIDTEGRRQADIVWNRVSYLADISNVAPMLGLLGTVLGMIKAFYGLESELGGIDAVTLSRGVGEAMSTTLFGLTVGIFTLVLYSLVKARATRTLADAEQAVHMIADHLKRDDSAIPSGR
ncbi:MAG: MotA/TolQ/ExbB proton channel family protein [Phycisphaeraceae bacterium]